MSNRREVAIAILHQDQRFLLQLRDDLPNIFYPGHWALFGGHIEAGESSDVAIQRELLEEINYIPSGLNQFGLYEDDRVIRHVYHAALEVELDALVLGEGIDMAWLTPEDIWRGDRYSQQIQQTRPLGAPHRQILLDFIETMK